ncbi:hypothetical protein SEA_LTON_7 [Gordonia phage Lton]|nr:hypothetical protein SEA_LTON_7 [Gordonia phage Lton]
MALISSGAVGSSSVHRAGSGSKEGDMAIDIENPETPGGNTVGTKNYDVVINGVATTLKLSDADAKARGLLKAEEPKKEPAAKKATPANKSRTASNKAAG